MPYNGWKKKTPYCNHHQQRHRHETQTQIKAALKLPKNCPSCNKPIHNSSKHCSSCNWRIIGKANGKIYIPKPPNNYNKLPKDAGNIGLNLMIAQALKTGEYPT
jgi:hypothetical protein